MDTASFTGEHSLRAYLADRHVICDRFWVEKSSPPKKGIPKACPGSNVPVAISCLCNRAGLNVVAYRILQAFPNAWSSSSWPSSKWQKENAEAALASGQAHGEVADGELSSSQHLQLQQRAAAAPAPAPAQQSHPEITTLLLALLAPKFWQRPQQTNHGFQWHPAGRSTRKVGEKTLDQFLNSS
ncbi:hypothetical protein GUJ93_ZPchr0458g22606 [Zizania palustris]|uniref:Uncharacterized protein n=1 Tax=Zizania palustris TaxID=103762 RepID=A0A8J5RLB5_ZIZPA|nr:hypothetical protein GUJ93_ZPchr0458g22606 [Zizania palustris]